MTPVPNTVNGLLAQNRIEPIAVDDTFARSHLDRAKATLQQASLLTDSAIQERLHYEAGLHVALGVLAHDGYRLKSGPGHHEVAVAYLQARLSGTPDHNATLDLDTMRRSRNGELYRAVTVGSQAAAASSATAQSLVVAAEGLIPKAT